MSEELVCFSCKAVNRLPKPVSQLFAFWCKNCKQLLVRNYVVLEKAEVREGYIAKSKWRPVRSIGSPFYFTEKYAGQKKAKT